MLVGEVRRRRRRPRAARDDARPRARPRRTRTSTTHAQPTTTITSRDEHDHDARGLGQHSHGGVRHSHLPPRGSTITWRSLFVLGLAGGLIPSTSALLILLGSIAAGRPGFGFVLVVAFGLGMAPSWAASGSRWSSPAAASTAWRRSSPLGRRQRAVPLAAAVLVFGFGLYLTAQAVGGTPVL